MYSIRRLFVLCSVLTTALPPIIQAANPNLVMDPSFDDMGPDARPRGWRPPFYEAGGQATAIPCVTDGVEGEQTHTGASALQFVFPPGSIPPEACTWSFDPAVNGIDIEPGDYIASFWMKSVLASERLQFELWDTSVPVEEYESGAQGIASKFLEPGDLPPGEWTKVELPFSVSRDGVRLAVSFHLKDAAPDSQVFIDDLEVSKD